MQKNGSPEKQLERVDVKALVHREAAFTSDDVRLLERVLGSPQLGEVRQEFLRLQRETAGKPSPTLLGRLGIGLYLLGHAREAERCLSQVSGNAVATFYRGWR